MKNKDSDGDDDDEGARKKERRKERKNGHVYLRMLEKRRRKWQEMIRRK